MGEGMYEKTTARVVVGEGASEEFLGQDWTQTGKRALFIAVMGLSSRKTVMKDAMKKLLYADDLLLANDKQDLIGAVEQAVYQTRAEN